MLFISLNVRISQCCLFPRKQLLGIEPEQPRIQQNRMNSTSGCSHVCFARLFLPSFSSAWLSAGSRISVKKISYGVANICKKISNIIKFSSDIVFLNPIFTASGSEYGSKGHNYAPPPVLFAPPKVVAPPRRLPEFAFSHSEVAPGHV